MVGLNTIVKVQKGKRYKRKANIIVIPSVLYRSPLVKTCTDEFQKITQDNQTLVDYALAKDGGKRYLLV